jgi:hypothetical protein
MVIWYIFGYVFGIFFGYVFGIFLVMYLLYFMVIWYIFPRVGMFYRKKSGNPDTHQEGKLFFPFFLRDILIKNARKLDVASSEEDFHDH